MVSWRGRTVPLALVDQGLVSGSNFLVALVLVRALGLEGYGAWALLWTIALFVVALQMALVSQPMLSLSARTRPEARSERRGSLLVVQALFSVLAAVGAWCAHAVLEALAGAELLEGTRASLVAAVLACQAYTFLRNDLFARGRLRDALLHDAIAYPGQLVPLLLLARTGNLDLVTTAWSITLTFLFASGFALRGFGAVAFERGAVRRALHEHWTFGRWLGLMGVVQWASSNAFLVAAGTLLGAGAAGALKAAHNVVGVLHVAFLALENVLPVQAARTLAAEGLGALVRGLRSVLVVGLFGTAAAGLLLWRGAEPILAWILGAAPGPDSVEALRGFTLLYVLAFAATILHIAYRTLGRTRPLALATMAVSAPVVLLAEPLVRAFGLPGAVYGMVGAKAALVLFLSVRLWIDRRPAPLVAPATQAAL